MQQKIKYPFSYSILDDMTNFFCAAFHWRHHLFLIALYLYTLHSATLSSLLPGRSVSKTHFRIGTNSTGLSSK